MASSYMPLWKQLLRKYVPVLFWACPAGNYHWRWNNRVCYCRVNEHCAPEWHGGVWVDGKELFTQSPQKTYRYENALREIEAQKAIECDCGTIHGCACVEIARCVLK